MAYKVFTNGSVLNASEINDNLMNQSVMVFSNSTARAAALTAPVEGMLTWLQDTNKYEYYSGTAWTALGTSAVDLINTTTFSAVTTQSINDVFSATYKNYKLVFNLSNASGAASFKLRMRVSGADNTSSNYQYGRYYVGAFTSVAAGNANNVTETSFNLGGTAVAKSYASQVNLYVPFLSSEPTKYTNAAAGETFDLTGGGMTVNTSYTGFTFFPSTGNMTGQVSVYGLKDS